MTALLLSYGARADIASYHGSLPFTQALNKGSFDCAKLVSPNTPEAGLFMAVAIGDMDTAAATLARRPDLARCRLGVGTPLHLAVRRGRTEMARLLLDSGAEVDAEEGYKWTPLLVATYSSMADSALVRLLIEHGANVNAATENGGYTPLHWAALRGKTEMASLLLDVGADVNARNGQGKTPLDLATEEGHEEVAELLRKHIAEE